MYFLHTVRRTLVPHLLTLAFSESLLLAKSLISIQPPVHTSSTSEVLCDSLHFRNNPLSYYLTLLKFKTKYFRDWELC